MRMDLSTVSVPEHPLHFGPRTSITTPLRSKGLEFRSLLLLHFEIRQQSSPYSVISMACSGKRVSQSRSHREGPFGNRNHLSGKPTIRPSGRSPTGSQ
jgi:hypothetical protein